MRITTLLLAAGIIMTPAISQEANAKKKKDKQIALAVLKKDSVASDYKKIIKDSKVSKGLFNLIYKGKEGKLYFEIPDSAFSRQYILANRIASTSDTQDYVAGQMVTTPMLIQLTKDERNVYFNLVQSNSVVDGEDAIRNRHGKGLSQQHRDREYADMPMPCADWPLPAAIVLRGSDRLMQSMLLLFS